MAKKSCLHGHQADIPKFGQNWLLEKAGHFFQSTALIK